MAPGGDRDLVLARLVDDDQRHARRRVQARDAGDVDALGLELRDGLLAQLVVSDRADEHDRSAEPRGGDRLVGALAAAVLRETPAGDGLAGARQARDGTHEVDVDRPDDDDTTAADTAAQATRKRPRSRARNAEVASPPGYHYKGEKHVLAIRHVGRCAGRRAVRRAGRERRRGPRERPRPRRRRWADGHGHGGIPKPIETDPCIEYAEGSGNTEFDDYWQPHEIDRAVRKLGREFKTSVIGLSNRGRPIYSVRTGHGRKVVFIQAGIHANELTGTTAVMNLLEDLDSNSRRNREIRDQVTLVFIPMLNVDGAVHYQRENDQTWAETQQRFPQLAGRPPAFYHQEPGPRFWGDPRVAGFDLNRDFNPNFNYVPQPEHLPGNGGVRGLNLTRESKASQGLYASLEREFRTVDVFVDLHNQAPCNSYDHDGDATHAWPLHADVDLRAVPAEPGGARRRDDVPEVRLRRLAARERRRLARALRRAAARRHEVTRYPQNLDLAGSANGSYQLHGSASVLMEAGRQRHANPEWNLSFIAKVHELAVRGIIDSVTDRWMDRIDPNRYEQIPIRY